MSDYYSRYAGMSHQQIYDLIRSGSPAQISDVGTGWIAPVTATDSIARNLRADLELLGQTWHGEASLEFQRRLGSIADYSAALCREFEQLHTGNYRLATSLSEAQAKLESPSASDDNDKMVSGAASGAAGMAWGGPLTMGVGAVVGAIDGHNQDEAEREHAHQRMIALIANLAGEYQHTAEATLRSELSGIPISMPGGTHVTDGAFQQAAGGPGVHSGPTFGPGGTSSTIGSDASAGTGSGLAGAATGPAGPGAGAGGSVGADLTGQAVVVGATGISVVGLAASTRGTISGGASGMAGSQVAPRPAPASEAVLGRDGADRASAVRTNQSGRSAVGPNGSAPEEGDERTTWLTEDDMDWGDDDAAPSVLGGQSPEQADGAGESTGSGPAPA